MKDIDAPGVAPETAVESRRAHSTRNRMVALLATLLLLAVLLPISRRYFLPRPVPPPPASAGMKALLRYYTQRIEADPSDVGAYVELGKREEAAGYFSLALKRLYAARALGAKEQDIELPLGRALTHLARFDEAHAELEKAVRLMPDSLEAAIYLAALYDSEGRSQEGAGALRDFVSRHKDLQTGATPARLNDVEWLMYSFLEMGDQDTALAMADTVVRLLPEDPEGYAMSGKLLLEKHQPRKAVERLEKASRLAPDEAALLYSYGLALSQTGHEDDALRQWQQTATLNPAALDAYYRMAEVYSKRKDYAHAAPALQQIALKDPANFVVVRACAIAFEKAGKTIPSAYWRALEGRLLKNYPVALSYAQKVVADKTWRKRGLTRRAEIYRDMHRMDDYVATIKQMADSGSAEDDVAISNAYGQADKTEEQTRYLKSALAKNPRDPAVAHYLLFSVYQRNGRRDEAETELEQAVAQDPKNVNYHLELGNLYFERRSQGDRLQRAIREFAQVALLSPDQVNGFQRMGIAYAAAGDLQRAAPNLEHAIDLQPGDGTTYQELGRVYARMGDKSSSDRMLQLYQKYVAYDLQRQTLVTKSRSAAKDASAQIAMAEFLEKAGDYPAAARYYRIACALRPTDAALKGKLRRVQTLMGQTSN